MDYKAALLSLGIVLISCAFYFVTLRKPTKNPKHAPKWKLFSYIGTLLLSSGSYAVSLWAIYLSSGGKTMNVEQGQQILAYAQVFGVLVLVIFGIMIGIIIDIFISDRKAKKETIKDNSQADLGDNLSSFKLKDSLETLSNANKAIFTLNDYVKKAKNIMDGEKDDQKEN